MSEVKITDGIGLPVSVDTQGYLMVKDIENWIQQLLPMCSVNDCFLQMKDVDTGAVFLIKRIK